MEKLKVLVSLLFSKAYIVLTDTRAVVSIPTLDLTRIDNVLLLGAQRAALQEFYDKMGDALKEHDATVKQMSKRKGSKLYAKKGKGRS